MSTSLTSALTDRFAKVFKQEGLAEALGQVRISDRPDLAQFQCNGALSGAKEKKESPRALAERIVAAVADESMFAKLEIAGPGFINIVLTPEAIGAHLQKQLAAPNLGAENIGQGMTAVLDYGGPNVGKPMHVGHIRSAFIGDTLRRLMIFSGFQALGDVHLGDWGTQMGQILMEFKRRNPDWVHFDENYTGPYPDEAPFTLADFEEVYPAASKACKEDEARAEEARAATVELQNKRPGYYALWRQFVDLSIAAIKANYEQMNVLFDLWKGEADVHDLIAPMVEGLKKDGFAVESDGALVVPVSDEGDEKEYPPLILYKRDGAVMYGTTDLATLVERMDVYKPARVVYAVDKRQHLHFEQLFRAAHKTGIVPEDVELTHAGFGTMNGTDGKPFKTREGGALKLEDLIEMARDKARQRVTEAELASDLSADEKEEIACKVALAAMRFADLQNPRQSDYVFDLDKLVSFEGKTGPYLLYQAVRIKSLLNKAGYNKRDAAALEIGTFGETETPLALLLTEFPDVIKASLANYTPHVLCDYLFRLAQAFSSFYNNCHILSEQDQAKKIGWLNLCAATLIVLEQCLDLIGLDVPEKM
ncbi:MAG: arginine--tRNA ligase [Pseudobdellovibrionaceae bacterium]